MTRENHVVPLDGAFNSSVKACASLSWIPQLAPTPHANVMYSLRSLQLKKSEKHKTVFEKVTVLRNRNPALLMQPEGFKSNLKNQFKHVGLRLFSEKFALCVSFRQGVVELLPLLPGRRSFPHWEPQARKLLEVSVAALNAAI